MNFSTIKGATQHGAHQNMYQDRAKRIFRTDKTASYKLSCQAPVMKCPPEGPKM